MARHQGNENLDQQEGWRYLDLHVRGHSRLLFSGNLLLLFASRSAIRPMKRDRTMCRADGLSTISVPVQPGIEVVAHLDFNLARQISSAPVLARQSLAAL